ncbi:hypothetical protein [Burkholderia gladioli]|uniref:hypothetical protein n=1 Tax=Burkholderia gladioli TaxID=28095 RepID=UPI001641358E|nr:hypothetical protein [Burkholderia gladioli]MBJ9673354.1 hypothetical protein [Burkholderia gladioli]MDN7464169.1 hypothetical protein [Burkholderia gladioli]
MPKHLSQQHANAVDDARLAGEINSAASRFRENVKAVLDGPGLSEVGLTWSEDVSVAPLGFSIETRSGIAIAAFDHISTGGQLLGRYRFYRAAGNPFKPQLKEFWSILVNESGIATWSIPGTFEWVSGNKSEVIDFVDRFLIEFYGTIEEI